MFSSVCVTHKKNRQTFCTFASGFCAQANKHAALTNTQSQKAIMCRNKFYRIFELAGAPERNYHHIVTQEINCMKNRIRSSQIECTLCSILLFAISRLIHSEYCFVSACVCVLGRFGRCFIIWVVGRAVVRMEVKIILLKA